MDDRIRLSFRKEEFRYLLQRTRRWEDFDDQLPEEDRKLIEIIKQKIENQAWKLREDEKVH